MKTVCVQCQKVRYLIIGMLTVFFFLILNTSCGPQYVYKADPYYPSKTNKYFTAKISPFLDGSGCKSFALMITNHTKKDLELIWDKTMYIVNDRTSGGFMFEGVVYLQRNNPKPPDVIFAEGRFSKAIYPNNLVRFVSGRYGGWRHMPMPDGENGVYLTVKVDGEEVHEKITTNIYREKVQSGGK